MNIVEPILFQAHCQPEASALCAQGVDVISYAQLAAQMSTVARRALSSGLRQGSVVALSIDEPLLHAVVILGLTQAGIVTVSVANRRPPSHYHVLSTTELFRTFSGRKNEPLLKQRETGLPRTSERGARLMG